MQNKNPNKNENSIKEGASRYVALQHYHLFHISEGGEWGPIWQTTDRNCRCWGDCWEEGNVLVIDAIDYIVEFEGNISEYDFLPRSFGPRPWTETQYVVLMCNNYLHVFQGENGFLRPMKGKEANEILKQAGLEDWIEMNEARGNGIPENGNDNLFIPTEDLDEEVPDLPS